MNEFLEAEAVDKNTLRIDWKTGAGDMSVVSSLPGGCFLEISSQDLPRGRCEYDTTGLVSLQRFLEETRFEHGECALFLHSLIRQMSLAAAAPVYLDIKAVYLSVHGQDICFAPVPLPLEFWLERTRDMQDFLRQVLESVRTEDFACLGLLYWALKEPSVDLEGLQEKLKALYRKTRKGWGRFSSFPEYISRQAVYPKEFGAEPGENAKPASPDSFVSSLLYVPELEQPSLPLQVQDAKEPDALSENFAGSLLAAQNTNFENPESAQLWNDSPAKKHLLEKESPHKPSVWKQALDKETPGETGQGMVSDGALPKLPVLPACADLNNPLLLDAPAFADTASSKADMTHEHESGLDFAPPGRQRRFGKRSARSRKAEETPVEKTQIMAILPASRSSLDLEGKNWPLLFEEVSVGRHPGCDIVLEDMSVSARHARIFQEKGRCYIQDLKSANGTYLDEHRIARRMRLKDGMEVRLGSCRGIFHE